jgi:hypothetical protein
MASRLELQDWVIAALKAKGGSGTIVEVAKHIWANHEHELRASGDLFFTWQYDMRWACTRLRERKVVQAAEMSDRGEWKLQPQLAA